MPSDTTTNRVIRAYAEFQKAKADMTAAGLTVPLGLDSAASVYAHGLEALGLPLDTRVELFKGGAGALKAVFSATVANPAARRQLALDSATVQAGFAARYPNVKPGRVV